MSTKVVTFGEIMLRLATPGFSRMVQAGSFDATYGGGEANVAVSLANFGIESHFVSSIPANPIGQAAENFLQRFGVKTDYLQKTPGRMGIYFLETGASQRPSQVLYDRAGSAVSLLGAEDYPWADIFSAAKWFHFTGITPALSDRAAEATLAACQAAKKAGVPVSCDLNYRKKLWSPEKSQEIMTELMKYVNIIIANEEDAEKVFGIASKTSNITEGALNEQGYREVARQLTERFNADIVAITLRESFSATRNGWSALLFDRKEYYRTKRYDIYIVDRVGGGDAFAAGLIYGSLQNWSLARTAEFAVAASCLKHTIPGDFNLVSVEEVEALAGGDASGRVQR